MISATGLTKKFGSYTAVSDVWFEVPSGRICALLGPNGAGKSTLVRMLTGLLPATSGTAAVCGFGTVDSRLKRMVSVLPESLALFDSLTVREHLELTGAVYRLEAEQVRYRSRQLLQALRMEDAAGRLIYQCSYGTKKKTALAMALLPNPRALFLDEPFEGIDPITSETIRLQLRAIAQRGVTVLLTSHLLSLVDRVADQVLLIHEGRIVLDREMASLPGNLEKLYFELVESVPAADLRWLGSEAS